MYDGATAIFHNKETQTQEIVNLSHQGFNIETIGWFDYLELEDNTFDFASNIDVSDVTLLLKDISGIQSIDAAQVVAGDFNSNNVSDTEDAISILKIIAGINIAEEKFIITDSTTNEVVNNLAQVSSERVNLIALGDVDNSGFFSTSQTSFPDFV